MDRLSVSNQFPSTLHASLTSWHAYQTTHGEINTWRRREAFAPLLSLSNGFLRQADEQTLLCLRTIVQLLESRDWPIESLSDWGIISAPRYLGRVLIEEDVQRFTREGPTTVSPHVIPHRSLHAVSGTISMALHSHGPNVGVGGGPGHLAQGLVTSLCTLEEQALPGVLLTFSEWEQEPIAGQVTGDEVCQTLVMALTSAAASQGGHVLSMTCDPTQTMGSHPTQSLTTLRDFLQSQQRAWDCSLDWGGQIQITKSEPVRLRA